MSPDGAFYDLRRFPSWTQYALASKSLLAALDIDNPEDTVMCQFTISETSLVSFGLLVLCRLFPEFCPVASDLSTKIADVSNAQGFLGSKELE